MHALTHLGLEEGSPRRTTLLFAVAFWAAGAVLAGANALLIHHAKAFDETRGTNTSAATGEGTGDTSPIVTMPEDVVIVQRPANDNATLMQKP
jgi:hypothetical protein